MNLASADLCSACHRKKKREEKLSWGRGMALPDRILE